MKELYGSLFRNFLMQISNNMHRGEERAEIHG